MSKKVLLFLFFLFSFLLLGLYLYQQKSSWKTNKEENSQIKEISQNLHEEEKTNNDKILEENIPENSCYHVFWPSIFVNWEEILTKDFHFDKSAEDPDTDCSEKISKYAQETLKYSI